MAWPKSKNRRSPAPAPTVDDSASDGAKVHVAPVEAGDTLPDADGSDVPFWESWAPADESIGLDDPGDGLPEDGPADDAVTDVDPRPRPPRSWERGGTATVTASASGAASASGSASGAAREETKAEGIGQRLGSLAHVKGHPRMRAWRRRIIVAVVFGVGFGYLLDDWRWGLTIAVLAGIADAIVRSRTTFNGPAGIRLTKAQKRTARQLSSLERKGYRAMHILPIPDSTEQIDHLVIGPAGVFAIDSEDWDPRIPVRTSSHRNLWHGPRNMKDRLEHARWEADQAATLLSAAAGSPVTVRPAMAVYGPKLMWDVVDIRDVDVFSGPRLRKYLRRRVKRRDARRLSASDIERIDKAAHKAFPQPQVAAVPGSRSPSS